MMANSSLDRDSFQTLLASAFAVQGSGMSKQSLSLLVELYTAITKDELPFEKILDLIADRARIVADATGVAIGLLTGDQLVYRAASGSSAQYIGRRVTAVLSASVHTNHPREILRVDNAENDARIEAAICRECAANALLIIPISRDRSVAGVLEVLFRDAHTFDHGEMRTYRLIANLVEEAMARQLKLSQKCANTAKSTAPQPPGGRRPSQMLALHADNEPASNATVVQVCGASTGVPGTKPTLRPSFEEETTIKWLRTFFHDPYWRLGSVAVVIVLGIAEWISLQQHTAFTMESVSRTRSTDSGAHASKASSNTLPNLSSGTQYANPFRPRFTRVRVGPNEVDYLAQDVTIRRFTSPPPSHAPAGYKRLDIGDDVTIRIFNYKPESRPKKSPCQPDATQ